MGEEYIKVVKSGASIDFYERSFVMLIGEYNHSIDAKGRVIMPAKLREDIGDTFYITISSQKGQCLKAFAKESWEEFFAKVSTIKESDRIAVRYKREVLSKSAQCNVDKQGRILIPDTLIEYAGLGKDITIIGQATYIELWDSGKWNEYNGQPEDISEEEYEEHLSRYGL